MTDPVAPTLAGLMDRRMSYDPFHEAVEALQAIGRKVKSTEEDLGF